MLCCITEVNKSISADEISAFKPSKIKAIDPVSIPGFKSNTLNAFTRKQIKSLTDEQIAGLTKRQIKKSNDFIEVLSELKTNVFSLGSSPSQRNSDEEGDGLGLIVNTDQLT